VINALMDFPVRAALRLCNDAASFRGRHEILGRLERPARRQVYSRWLDVRGWARAVQGDPLTMRFTLNGRLLQELPVEGERFEGEISLESWGRAAGILTAAAVSPARPDLRRTLGVSLIRRRGANEREVPRAAYQRTWDAVSRSLSDARYSVAGTNDAGDLDKTGESTALDIIKETALRQADRVLEIGCGVGRVGVKLASRCGHWTGADVSAHMLGHARQALAGVSNVSFVPLNGIDLEGVADASMDVVYCTAVFMHLDEWERYRYVVEAFRVLKPGGRIYYDNFSLLSPDGWRLFLDTARLDPAARPPNVSKASTPEELRAYAQHAGFEEIRVRPGDLFATVIARKPAV
jgi:SAM-dependent methyltransferase